MQYNDIFQKTKDHLNCREIAADLGFEFKGVRAKCLLHGGDGLNFHARQDGFTCFSQCGSGSVIDLVMQFHGFAKPIDAVRWLNERYKLGLELEKVKAQSGEVYAPSIRTVGYKEASRVLCQWLNRLERWTRDYSPCLDGNGDAIYSFRWEYAVKHIDYFQHLYDALWGNYADVETIDIATRLKLLDCSEVFASE